MGLYHHILNEKVKALALRELVAVQPETPVREAIARLRHNYLGCAIAVDEKGKPIGAFTERRLTRALASGDLSLDAPVSRYLETPVAIVEQHEPIRSVIRGMIENGTRFVCVTDEAGRALALTGQKGLMECIAEYFPRQVQAPVHHLRDEHHDDREGA